MYALQYNNSLDVIKIMITKKWEYCSSKYWARSTLTTTNVWYWIMGIVISISLRIIRLRYSDTYDRCCETRCKIQRMQNGDALQSWENHCYREKYKTVMNFTSSANSHYRPLLKIWALLKCTRHQHVKKVKLILHIFDGWFRNNANMKKLVPRVGTVLAGIRESSWIPLV